jgi:hypothetical protein
MTGPRMQRWAERVAAEYGFLLVELRENLQNKRTYNFYLTFQTKQRDLTITLHISQDLTWHWFLARMGSLVLDRNGTWKGDETFREMFQSALMMSG